MRYETETKAKVEAGRLYKLIESGQQPIKIKGQAIDVVIQQTSKLKKL